MASISWCHVLRVRIVQLRPSTTCFNVLARRRICCTTLNRRPFVARLSAWDDRPLASTIDTRAARALLAKMRELIPALPHIGGKNELQVLFREARDLIDPQDNPSGGKQPSLPRVSGAVAAEPAGTAGVLALSCGL